MKMKTFFHRILWQSKLSLITFVAVNQCFSCSAGDFRPKLASELLNFEFRREYPHACDD
jgi:hypothetical protein